MRGHVLGSMWQIRCCPCEITHLQRLLPAQILKDGSKVVSVVQHTIRRRLMADSAVQIAVSVNPQVICANLVRKYHISSLAVHPHAYQAHRARYTFYIFAERMQDI